MATLLKLPALASRFERAQRLTAIISQLSEADFDALWQFVTALVRQGKVN